MKPFLTYYKWTAISVLSVIAVLDILYYVNLKVGSGEQDSDFNRTSILVLVCFILLFLYPNKINWFAGLGLCIFGLFEITVVASRASATVSMDFTAPFYFYHDRNAFRIGIGLLPMIFYLTTIIVLLTKGGRRYYNLVK